MSMETASFDKVHTNSYWPSTVAMFLYCTVFDI